MTELENRRKERTVTRRLFTKSANEFEEIVNRKDAQKNQIEINIQFKKVREIYESLLRLDKNIKESLGNCEEEGLEKELESQLDYRTKWLRLDALFEQLYKSVTASSSENKTTATTTNLKLPKLNLQMFDGDLKNWIPFYSQFEKIERDTNLDKLDKYQYLLQSMKEGSEVQKFIESFPATAYDSCMRELKQRYAREDLLIQIYIREILALVLTDQKDSITNLYDKLNAQLRALETLNVTKEKYANFLLPMVESSLPQELLRVWERQKQPCKDVTEELTNVLNFLRREVEGEQRIEMTRKTFNKTKTNCPAEKEENQPFTAECLLTNIKKKQSCIWCDKDTHSSIECYKLPNMSQDQRRDQLKKKRACMICLRPGHHAKVCKTHVKCLMCGRRHNVVFCNSSPKHENNRSGASINLNKAGCNTQETSRASCEDGNSTQTAEPSNPTALSSAQQPIGGSENTLLQTAVVNIYNGKNVMKVRALFDNGAQRSYIREDVALKMNIPAVGKEILSHNLFGGVEISSKNHNVYKVKVGNLDRSFDFQMTVLGQPCICKSIPRYNGCNKTLADKLRKYNVDLQDTNENLTDTNIGILIGADFSGLLMTGTVINIMDSLVAIRTKVGWTLQGKINQSTTTSLNVNLFCASEPITNFWSLDTLGIRDPAETKAGVQTEEEMMSWYQENTKVNKEGRYEVCLPYKVGHDDILSNKDLATRRLESVTKRLISTSAYDDYDDIFKEWQDLKIIEPVPELEEAHRPTHYLPHRPVIKESSLTTRIRPVFDASAKDKQGKSLNASLEKGVNFLDKVPKLLTGFRRGQIGVTADIAKAFLQISVAPQERDMLRFLWWENGEIKSFRHCRLVFGLTSSPFLLSATILSHLDKVTGEMKDAAQLLSQSFYVDNCITSLNTEEAVYKFQEDAKVIMSQAKFDLRQWVIAPIQEKKQKGIVPVLGLEWHLNTDHMACNLSSVPPKCELGSSNWADVASRGCNPRQLLSSRWWEGPPWLLLPAGEWPQSEPVVDEKEVRCELKKSACVNVCQTKGMTENFLYFSQYSKIIRTVAWILRFIKNCRKKTGNITGEISCEEYEKAENSVIKLIQKENKNDIEKRVGNLTHFYDKEFILRVKTRLILTDVPESTKYPAVIPAVSPIARRMVEQRHIQLQHAGTNILIADIRCKFWIIGLRHLVKSVISTCTICKRFRAKPIQAPMAPLPTVRTQCTAPFETTGVDLAGPLLLKTGEKCWIVLFTCAVYRAVHLELTNSVSTEAFLMTLRRFIARRGRATLMISDNGTNFSGTYNLFSTIDWDKVIAQSSIKRIKWKFNAPTAAWWGGFWERLIRILKDLLKRILGKSCVDYEEMVTLLCDCEATMNARPLTYIEDARTDCLEPLMPSHFLQPLVQTDVTDLDTIDTFSMNKRMRYLQKLRADLRQRFKSEYLTALVQRGKDKKHQLKIGDIVLIENNDKRVKWPLGMVIELFVGADSVVRSAKVKTSSGIKVRPVQRLYSLEINGSETELLEQPTVSDPEPTVLQQPTLNESETTTLHHPPVSQKTTKRGRAVKLPSRCFCQSEDGERTFGEVLNLGAVTARNMHCGCSRLHSKIQKGISPGVPYPVMGPRCTSEGNFNPVQCIDRVCYCVDRITGAILGDQSVNLDEKPLTELRCYDSALDLFPEQSEGDPPYNYTTPCFERMIERIEFLQQSEEDGYNVDYFSSVPDCLPDGTFGRISYDKNQSKICVNQQGVQIADYEALPTTQQYQDMDCKCAETSLLMESSIEQLVCCSNGNFRTIQCRRGLCRCVDPDGRQLGQESSDVTALPCYKTNWRDLDSIDCYAKS